MFRRICYVNFSLRAPVWKERSLLYAYCFTDSTEQKSEFASCSFVSPFFQFKHYTLLKVGSAKRNCR